ncbi:MAG: hypothetical protein IH591_07455, partial [Bacteroidales bacterium]|nr:hypothetical protein [Bacteroidales bacterium]
MKSTEVENLLEKFYEGVTSESDELQLVSWLNSEDLPDSLKVDRDIVLSLISLSDNNKPDNAFENRLRYNLHNQIKRDSRPVRRSFLYASISTAATILVVIGLWFLAGNNTGPDDTFSNPEQAYAETMKALYKVSDGMNRGVAALYPIASFGVAEDAVKGLG